MPIKAVIDREKQIVYTMLEGLITIKDWEHHQRTTGMDASLFGFDEIVDMTAVTQWNIFNLDIVKIARTANTLPAIDINSRLAVICTTEKCVKIVRFYAYIKKLLRKPWRKMKVLKSVTEAEQWFEAERSQLHPGVELQ